MPKNNNKNGKELRNNNQVTLVGHVVSAIELNREVGNEKFYRFSLRVERPSNIDDIIPVVASGEVIDPTHDYSGEILKVEGYFSSYNHREGEKSRLILSVMAKKISTVDQIEEGKTNRIYLEGHICKEPVYRETPLGREITDVLLAVAKPGGSNYIPCICWGRNAKFAGTLSVGTKVKVQGRIQSREYKKELNDGTSEKRVAYEVSIFKVSAENRKKEDVKE